jgi:hypothetical protein
MKRKFQAAMGIKVKGYIDIENTSEVLVVKRNVTFNQADYQNYVNMFADLIEDEALVNCEFDDNRWYVCDDYLTYTLSFNYELYPEINKMLKCYTALKMAEKHVGATTAYSELVQIQKSIQISNLFNLENLVEYTESIKNWSDTDKQGLYFVREFLTFCTLNDSAEYIDIIQDVKIPPSQVRPLPSYKSILKFHYLLTDYMDNADSFEKERYFPLLIWWLITKIIPMRPIEFDILKRNCMSPGKDTGTYFIHIERKKFRYGHVSFRKIEPLNDIQVTKEIYDLVQEYLQMVDPNEKNLRLLSYKSYCEHHPLRRDIPTTKKNPDIMTTGELRTLLLLFYDRVISEKFTVIEKANGLQEIGDNEIERICIGDTRHIAFCEMLLQGLNPLTIAQIGGHNTLNEQMFYQKHLAIYIDAKTYLLSKILSDRIFGSVNRTNVNEILKKGIIARAELGDEFYTFLKVPGGRCNNKNFPHECILDDCLFHIPYFIPDDTLTQEMINSSLLKVNKELAANLYCIEVLVKSMNVVVNTGEYNLQDQEKLKTHYNSLNSLVNKKAVVEAYKMNLENKHGKA